MMVPWMALTIGAALHAAIAATVYFAPAEPYKPQIVIASAIRGALVGLLVAYPLTPGAPWWHGAGRGALYGSWTAAIVFFAKGGFKSKDAPFILPTGLVVGAITGFLVQRFA